MPCPGAPQASDAEGTSVSSATTSLERALRLGRRFMLYDRHDLDVTRASEAAGGFGVACRLADLPPETDFGGEGCCRAEVHVCSADSQGKIVELHRVCRPAGPYERLEDVSAEIAARWAAPSGWPAKGTQEDRIPRRRRRMQVDFLPTSGAGATAKKVLALAEKLLHAAIAGLGSVQWGILFRVSPLTAAPAKPLTSCALSPYCRQTNRVKRQTAVRQSLVDKARRTMAAALQIAKRQAQSRRGRPSGSCLKAGPGRSSGYGKIYLYALKPSQCQSNIRGRGRPRGGQHSAVHSAQSKPGRSWSIEPDSGLGKMAAFGEDNQWSIGFFCRACSRDRGGVRNFLKECHGQQQCVKNEIMESEIRVCEEAPLQVLAPLQLHSLIFPPANQNVIIHNKCIDSHFSQSGTLHIPTH